MMRALAGSLFADRACAAQAAAQARHPQLAALTGWGGEMVALATGALYTLSFAPSELGAAAYPLLALFFLACAETSTTRAAWRGWLFGVAQFAFGAGWLNMGLHYGSTLTVASVGATSLVVGVLAIYPALAALTASLASGGRPLRVLVAFPFAWIGAEYLRSIGMTAFPWALLGYSQIDTPLAGYAPLFGVYGTGLIAASIGAALALLLLYPRVWLPCAAAVTALFLFGAQLSKVAWSSPVGAPIRVALLQGNAIQDEKWSNHMRARMLNWYQEKTRENFNHDLIIWPETAIADSAQNVASYLAGLTAISVRDNKDVIVGVVEGDFAKGGYFNSLVSLRGGVYHKRRLIPLAEYFPWPDAPKRLADALRLPVSDFREGEEQQPLVNAAGYALGTTICFELAFSGEVRRALPDARLLVNIGNDAAFRNSTEPHQHHQMARFRALETGRFLIRAVNTGISAIIGPHGEVVAGAEAGKETVVSGKAQPLGGTTPYVLLGDGPVILLAVAGIAVVGAMRLRRDE